MTLLLDALDCLLFIPFLIWIVYVVVFAVAYRLPNAQILSQSNSDLRYMVIFPAYKEDAVIVESVTKFLAQDFPIEQFHCVVVADSMRSATLDALSKLPISLVIPDYTKRSKAAAINYALHKENSSLYQAVVVLDADNHVDHDFLKRVNAVFGSSNMAIQVHRKAKNQHTDVALLDGVSEEINNAIFREGHNKLGLPAALSGSGMIFDMKWFRHTMAKIDSVGEDKELEFYLLEDRIHTLYLTDVCVYDEKVSKRKDLSNQRKRWMAAQLELFMKLLKQLPLIIKEMNWPMLDKFIQMSIPPRILLLGWIPIWIIILGYLSPMLIRKWAIIYVLLSIALLSVLPRRFYTIRTVKALFKLPILMIAYLKSLLGVRSAKNKFIHTPHGESEKNNNH